MSRLSDLVPDLIQLINQNHDDLKGIISTFIGRLDSVNSTVSNTIGNLLADFLRYASSYHFQVPSGESRTSVTSDININHQRTQDVISNDIASD